MTKQHKQRAKNLRDADIEAIVKILDGWVGELTWHTLINAIKAWQNTDICYSRQALHLHEHIRIAYRRNKMRLSEVETTRNKELKKRILAMTSELLEAEKARLNAENKRYLRQFICHC